MLITDSVPNPNPTIMTARRAARKQHVDELPSQKSMDIWAMGCVLYQIVTGRQLLADLAGWQDDISAHDLHACLEVWANLYTHQAEGQLHLNRVLQEVKPVGYGGYGVQVGRATALQPASTAACGTAAAAAGGTSAANRLPESMPILLS